MDDAGWLEYKRVIFNLTLHVHHTGCSLVEMKNQKQEKERKNDNIVFFSTHVI